MTQHEALSTTDVIAERVKKLRNLQEWSAADLARRCVELGQSSLNRSVIANIESGRRRYVTVDELLVLSLALNVAAVHLCMPLDNDTPVQVAADTVVVAGVAREWIRGRYPLPGQDTRTYRTQVPDDEWSVEEASLELRREVAAWATRHNAALHIERMLDSGSSVEEAAAEWKRLTAHPPEAD